MAKTATDDAGATNALALPSSFAEARDRSEAQATDQS
jgi:hypothetical protein